MRSTRRNPGDKAVCLLLHWKSLKAASREHVPANIFTSVVHKVHLRVVCSPHFYLFSFYLQFWKYQKTQKKHTQTPCLVNLSSRQISKKHIHTHIHEVIDWGSCGGCPFLLPAIKVSAIRFCLWSYAWPWLSKGQTKNWYDPLFCATTLRTFPTFLDQTQAITKA